MQKVQPPEREAPRPKVLPAGAIIKLAPDTGAAHPNAPAAAGPPSPRTLVLADNFAAEADNNTVFPPDTQGTVGPNHLVVTLNSNVVVQDRSGSRLKVVSLDAFWAPTGNTVTTDPRVAYDPFNDRWIMATSGDFLRSTSGVLVGVTQTGDPTGNWNLFKVAVDSTNLHFCDFPVLGFNKKWVVVMCNVFANAANSNFFAGSVYVFDKFDLYNGGSGAHTVLDTGQDSNVTPAITYDNNLETEYLVEEFNGNQNGMGLMRLWQITGPVASPTLAGNIFPATSVPWGENGTANFAPQLGSTTGLDTGDARIGNVIYRNGNLWTAHPAFFPCCAPSNPPNRSAIQWWEIDTSGNVLQRNVIDSPDRSFFRSYPSIAVNQFDDALIGYARFSASEHPGGFYSFHSHQDAPSVLEAETALKPGEAVYVKTGSGTSNRWGDYSNTSVDPVDDTSFWTIQEYAAEPSSHWATWWGHITPFGPPAAFQVSQTPPGTLTAGVPLTDFVVSVVDAGGAPVPNYSGTVHFTSTDPGFTMPDYTFVPSSDHGIHHFSGVTLFKAGAQSITLADLANAFQNQVNFTVVPGPPSAFSTVSTGSQTAGVPFTFTLTVKDAFQNVATNYTGTVHFTSSDPSFSMPDYTFSAMDSGTHQFSGVRLFKAGAESITLSDAANSLQTQMNFTVSPAAPATLVMVGASPQIAGMPFSFTVTAKDAFQNTVTSYGQTVHFSSSDPAASLPAPYAFVGADNGAHTFNGAILRTAGTQNIIASDGSIFGSMQVNVTPAAGDHLVVSAPVKVTRTKPFTISVTAQDAFNNIATGYVGTIGLTTSDPSGSVTLPPNYTFTAGDKGLHYFVNGVTLDTIGNETVTATDTMTSSITGSTSVNVTHLSGTARDVRVRLGQPFNLVVAEFTDDANPPANMVSATIDWGDGTATSPGVVSGGYVVTGGHTYTSLPEHPIMISILDSVNTFSTTLTGTVRIWPKTESH